MARFFRIAVLAAAVVLVVVVVPIAGADGPMPGTENLTMNLPAGGTGSATRSPMPANATTGTVGVTATSDDDDFINSLTELLSGAPTRGARVVTCVFLSTILNRDYGEISSFTLTEPSIQLLFINVCLHLALSMQPPAAAHTLGQQTAAGCSPFPLAAPIHIVKSGSGWKATVSGSTSKPKKLRFRVSCKRTATSLSTVVKSSVRHGRLAKAIGPKLGVGFMSTSASSAKLKIALGVK